MHPYEMCSNDELVKLLLSSDEQAFAEIYNRNWHRLYNSAYKLLEDEDAVVDILQEVFVWFWNNRTTLNIRSLQNYLYVAVKYKVSNYIRNQNTRHKLYEKFRNLHVDLVYDETSVELKELISFIKEFTEALPEKCREVFQLSRFENLNNKEIASKLGISEKTVENHITVALNKLRKKMDSSSAWMIIFF